MTPPFPLLVVVAVAGRMLALPSASIAELVHEPALIRPPRLPSAVAGLFDLRGTMVPVVRSDLLLGLPPLPPGPFRVVLVFHPDPVAGRWALLVERAVAVIEGESIESPPPSHWLGGCVTGIVREGDMLLPVVDPRHLLERGEAQALAELAERARRRHKEFSGGDI